MSGAGSVENGLVTVEDEMGQIWYVLLALPDRREPDRLKALAAAASAGQIQRKQEYIPDQCLGLALAQDVCPVLQ